MQVAAFLALLALAFGLLLAFVAACIDAFRRWGAGKPLVQFEPRTPVPWNVAHVLGVLVIWISLQIVASALAAQKPGEPLAMPLAHVLGDAIAVLVIVLFLRMATRASWRDLGWSFEHLGDDAQIGIRMFALLSIPLYVLQGLLHYFVDDRTHPIINELSGHASDPTVLLLAATLVVVAAPVIEEIVFRLVLQGGLERASCIASQLRSEVETSTAPAADEIEIGDDAHSPVSADIRPGWWPIFASAFLFAILHLQNGPDPIPIFLLALALGYVYRQTHRLTPSIVMHCSLNGVSMLIFWLSSIAQPPK